jgi:2-dehydropantoate 2-reductase
MREKLRVLTIGAGAIGTYVGGSLALDGHQVTFLERPEMIEPLISRGLRLNLHGKDFTIRNPQVQSADSIPLNSDKYDIAIFALKSYDTSDFFLSPTVIPQYFPSVLCLSNGVENESIIAQTLGGAKVIAGTVTSAVGRRAPGDIILERLRGMGVAAGHPLSHKLVDCLDGAGLNARLFQNAVGMKWSKLLTNLIANATSAILNMTPAAIFSHPGLYRLENTQLRETLSVMKLKGIQVVDLPGTPVRMLVYAISKLPSFLSRLLLKRAVSGGRGGKMPSFHIDLYRGRGKTEVDFLNGAVVRAAGELNYQTPINRSLTNILINLSTGKIPLQKYQMKPDKLLNDIFNPTSKTIAF